MQYLSIYGKSTLIKKKDLKEVFDSAVKILGSTQKKVSLIFVTEEAMKSLNKEYRSKDRVTDVLSFNYDEDDFLGEIYICTRILRKQAKEFQTTPAEELNRLFVHGVVHLHGFDHEKSEKEKLIMEKKEEEILNLLAQKH